jgi:hypothetical protein
MTIRIGLHHYTAADPLPTQARKLITDLGLDPAT